MNEAEQLVNAALAADKALQMIKERSFSARNPHLGKMVKCQVCLRRHRENEYVCVQKFATDEKGVVYGELLPPEGLTHLTARQVLGAARFNKQRRKPRKRPQRPMTKWERVLKVKNEKETCH